MDIRDPRGDVHKALQDLPRPRASRMTKCSRPPRTSRPTWTFRPWARRAEMSGLHWLVTTGLRRRRARRRCPRTSTRRSCRALEAGPIELIVSQFSLGAGPHRFETASRLSRRHDRAALAELDRPASSSLRFQCFLASRHANQSLCTLAAGAAQPEPRRLLVAQLLPRRARHRAGHGRAAGECCTGEQRVGFDAAWAGPIPGDHPSCMPRWPACSPDSSTRGDSRATTHRPRAGRPVRAADMLRMNPHAPGADPMVRVCHRAGGRRRADSGFGAAEAPVV